MFYGWYISGFATYVEFLGTQHVMPESQLRDRQLIIGQQMVFQLDALESSKAKIQQTNIAVKGTFYSEDVGEIVKLPFI